jgi:hypothetical protein
MKSDKFLLFVLLGIIFWLNGVFVIRLVGPYLLTESNPFIFIGFLLAIPVTALTLVVAKYLGKLSYNQLLKPVVIMTFTATSCDAIAFTWFHHIYNSNLQIALNGAALILWGAGLGLAFAYYLDTRKT